MRIAMKHEKNAFLTEIQGVKESYALGLAHSYIQLSPQYSAIIINNLMGDRASGQSLW